ncbi:hypothetical protein COOONC_28221 [Cooperia oncophora]
MGNRREYRVTPHPATRKSPAEILMGRQLRTTLDIRKTKNKESGNSAYRERMIADYNKRGRKERSFTVGQQVYIRNYQKGDKWIPGIITQVLGSRMYDVHFGTGSRKVHTDQLKERLVPDDEAMLTTRKRNQTLEEELPQRRSGRTRKLTDKMQGYVEEMERSMRAKTRINKTDMISHVGGGERIKGEEAVRWPFMWTYTPPPYQPSPTPPPYQPPPMPAGQLHTGTSPAPIVIHLITPPTAANVEPLFVDVRVIEELSMEPEEEWELEEAEEDGRRCARRSKSCA